jgi:hypothetical protein
MRISIKLLFLLTIIMFATSCYTGKKQVAENIVITPLSDTIKLREGSIVYGLPRSVFKIAVVMKRTLEIPGPYAKYAGDLLGLDKVIMNEKESWIVEKVSLISGEELDPSEYYMIESNTLFQTNVLKLKKQGLILDLNPALYYSSDNQMDNISKDLSQIQWSDLGADEYFQLQRDTAYKRVTIDSSFVRIPYIVEKKKKLSSDQLAEKAAKRLMELRDGKHLILTGEATVFPQNEAAITEINRIEKEYTELFAGKSLTETMNYTLNIIPSKEMIGKPVVIFRFSELTGPSAISSTAGKAISVEFTPERKSRDLTVVSKPAPDPKMKGYDKLYYRVPEVVNVKITQGNESLISTRRLIYQFGQVVQLPANYIIGK